ncbi:hypothetical protein PENSPDRAFT_736013 [Peniophora sp. CONT]|nr:hypothetical protein PENSPDRAFT_736013 [Peniophora sp. CONT]
MHANAANVLALFTVVASVAPAFAAPLSTIERIPTQLSHPTPALAVEQRSAAAIGKALADGAVEGLSAGAAGAAIDTFVKKVFRRDVADLDARSLSAIEDFFSNLFKRDLDERSAAAIGKAVAAGLASGALEAGVTSLVDKLTSRDVEERSAAAIGKALADGAVEGLSAGAAEAAIDTFVKKVFRRDVADLDARSLSAIEDFLSNIFKRDYGLEERSAAAVGKAIAAGIGSGALEAGVTSLVNKFTGRAEGDIYMDDSTGIIYADLADGSTGVEARSAAAVGKAIAAGVASGALEAGVTSLVDKLTSRDVPEARSLTAIANFFHGIFGRDVEERSAAAIGKAVVAGLGSGALEGGVTSLVNKLTGRAAGDVFVDDSTGIIYADMGDEATSEKRAVGAILKGLASGAGGGILKGIYNDLTDRSINELD